MNREEKERFIEISKKIIENVEKRIKPYIGKSESGKIVKMGADGTPTKYIDLIAEEEVINILKNNDFISYLISEEIGELKIGKGIQDPVNISKEISSGANKREDIKFIFVVDPLDGTSNAIKNIPAYGISIAIAEIPDNEKLATLDDVKIGLVKNFDNGDFYEAVKGEGSKLNENSLIPSDETILSKVLLGGFIKVSNEVFNLVKKIRRIRLLGSVVLELCFISKGKYDIFIDLRGSRVIDIAASKLIVEESGGIITDQFGKKLKNKLSISEKNVVVGVGNEKLHNKVIKIMNNENINIIKNVGIISRLDKKETILFAGKIIQRLLKQNITVSIENSLAIELEKLKNENNLKNIIKDIEKTNSKIAEELKGFELKTNFKELGIAIENFQTDMIITLGGDGTILRTQNQLNEHEIPIFGINMGTVGFLTEIETNQTFETLEKVLKGNYYKEKRTQLIVSHENHLFTALNEVVIMTEKPAKMLNFEIRVDGEVMEEFRADGLILSTPSGSTAYSMSAGGPIVDPKVGAFIIIPICPYKLGFRAFVVSDKSEITVKLLKKGKKAIFVMDGQINKEINYLEELKFKKSPNDVYFIRTSEEEFYQKVKEKLTEGGINSDRQC